MSSPTEYRDLGLLKFFFAELAQPGDVIALAHQQAVAQRAQLAGYEAIVARFGNRPELAPRVRTAELGIRLATPPRSSGRTSSSARPKPTPPSGDAPWSVAPGGR